MPTFLALLLSSCASLLVAKLFSSLWLSLPISSLVGIIVYVVTRRFLKDLRP